MTDRTKKKLLIAAAALFIEAAPRGLLMPTTVSQALVRAVRNNYPTWTHLECHTRAHSLLRSFYAFFPPSEPVFWDYDDRESRCIALLLLAHSLE